MPRLGPVVASLLRNMKGESHRAVPRAAEHRAVPHEIAHFVGSKGKLRRLTFLKLRVQVQFFEFQPVSHIFGRQYENDWPALFQGYLCRGVGKLFYRHLDSLRSVRSRIKSGESYRADG